MAVKSRVGRRYTIRGRVQGVGFRDFVQKEARQRGITGYVRNLADGSVLVCAIGTPKATQELEARIRDGPTWADVRAVEVEEMGEQDFDDFRVVH